MTNAATIPGTSRIASAPDPGKRVAYVVGNSAYKSVAHLPGPVIDHERVVDSLRTLGFTDVFGGTDLTLEAATQHFQAYLQVVPSAETALFYYSGHGIQTGNGNFIVPVDFHINAHDPESQLLPLKPWIADIQQALATGKVGTERKTCLVFLDACRDNPWTTHGAPNGTRSIEILADAPREPIRAGLADMEIDGDETFIAFATAPGTWAIDGAPSPFTKAVTRYAGVKGGVDIDDIMRWVAQAVRNDTKNRQRPWSHGNLTSGWTFVPRDPAPARILALLGFLAGLFAARLVFDEDGHLYGLNDGSAYDRIRHVVVGLTFGLVIGVGVWTWGRRVWWAPIVACLGTAVAYLASMSIIQPFAWAYDNVHSPTEMNAWMTGQKFNILLNAIIASSLTFAVGTVASGAVSTIALRRPSAFIYALMAGASVTAIYLAVEGSKVFFVQADVRDMSQAARFVVSWLVIPVAGGIWFGIVAYCIGYSIVSYVPRTRSEADRNLDDAVGR